MLLFADRARGGGGVKLRDQVRLHVGGLQGVRQAVQQPQVAGEPCSPTRRKICISLHRGGLPDEVQLPGPYFIKLPTTQKYISNNQKYFNLFRAL